MRYRDNDVYKNIFIDDDYLFIKHKYIDRLIKLLNCTILQLTENEKNN